MFIIWNVERAKEVGRRSWKAACRIADRLEVNSGEQHIVLPVSA